MLGLGRKRKPDPTRRRQLQADVHRLLGLGPQDVVRVSEDSCGDPTCAVLLTLLVMREERPTEVHHVDGDLASITAAELIDAMRTPTLQQLARLFAEALKRLDRKDSRDEAEAQVVDRRIG